MKNILTIALLVLTTFSSLAQNRLYENPQFDRIARDHKVIAVMPFKTTITLRPRQMKQLSPGQLEKMEEAEGKGIQASLYSWFLTREKRGKLTVDVQDPKLTNAKLRQAQIDMDSYENYTPAELADLLEVDAVVMGSFDTDKPISEATAVIIESVFGLYGATNKAVMNLYIYNADDNEVLVNYHKSVAGSLGSTSDNLINRLMRKASRKIAYTQ